MIRRAFAHYYKSGCSGILRVVFTCGISRRPLRVSIGHESYPLLTQADDREYWGVVLKTLASVATEFGVEFCAPIPSIDQEQAKCFYFGPNRTPIEVAVTASSETHEGDPWRSTPRDRATHSKQGHD